MKHLSHSLIRILIVFGLLLEFSITSAESYRDLAQDPVTGNWLGELEIPNTAKLRMV